ncbi:MAG: DUF1934 domain-containing protein [Velocimicrobium sp.]
MKKEVLVSIAGLQFELDQDEAMEVISPGEYYFKNGKHYIFYEEITEIEGQDSGISNARLTVSSELIELTKKGFNNVSMIFEPGKKTMTYYKTPYGELMIGIHTNQIHIEEQELGILVSIDYSLDINYSHVSDCNIVIKIVNRKEGSVK